MNRTLPIIESLFSENLLILCAGIIFIFFIYGLSQRTIAYFIIQKIFKKYNLAEKKRPGFFRPYSGQIKLLSHAFLMRNVKLENSNDEKQMTISFLSQLQKVMDAGAIVFKTDIFGDIIYVNDKFCEITGYSREELMGLHFNSLRHPDVPQSVYNEIWERIQSKEIWNGKLKNTGKDGRMFHVDMTIVPILDEKNRILEYSSISSDITEIIKRKEEITSMHYTDKLTGYYARSKLLEDIKTCSHPGLAIFNIDNFSELNEFFGNDMGDQFIIALGINIKKNLSAANCIYRLHGDEFVVLRSEVQDQNEFVKEMENVLSEILDEPLVYENLKIPVRLTVGITFSRTSILETANMAIKIARRNNINLTVYSDELNMAEEFANNLKWTTHLKKSIDDEKIIPYYQPIKDNRTDKIEKYECLARMILENGEVVTPPVFLDIAKKAKLYRDLTRAILTKSVQEFRDSSFEFSINLTMEDVVDRSSQNYILETLEENSNVAGRIIFEIVESERIVNYADVVQFFMKLKRFGSKVAIDDFGTGYSNFEYLIELRPDFIKIDGSLIKNINYDYKARSVVETIILFAKKMGILTVAEYVHSESIQSVVKDLGIDFSQGFFIGKPLRELTDSTIQAESKIKRSWV